MTKELKRQLRKYYHDISKSLPCFGKSKRAEMDDLKTNINNYLEENPNASIDDIIERFDSAEEFVTSYINSKDPKEIEDYHKRCEQFKKIAIVFSFVVLIVVGVITSLLIKQIDEVNIKRIDSFNCVNYFIGYI